MAKASRSTSKGNRTVKREPVPPCCKVVLTGGPGAGKTTAADLFRRELGQRVVVVPETATMLFGGGFPRNHEPATRRAVQTAIFHVQRNLEEIQQARFPGRVLLCDRGTVDGAAYWPNSEAAYFEAQGTTLEAELARYDEVLFFESAAVGGLGIEGGNPVRTETMDEAIALDQKLKALWSRHPRFSFVAHDASFLKKTVAALAILGAIVARHDARCAI